MSDAPEQSWPDSLLAEQLGNFQMMCDSILNRAVAALTVPGCMTADGRAVQFWQPLSEGSNYDLRLLVNDATISLGSIEEVPREMIAELGLDDVAIKVTLNLVGGVGSSYQLTGLRIDPGQFGVYYGPDSTQAALAMGVTEEGNRKITTAEYGPMFLYPYGKTATMYSTFIVPRRYLHDMALIIAPVVNNRNADGNLEATPGLAQPSPVVLTHLDKVLTLLFDSTR